LQFEQLRAASFPKLLARGAWKPEVAGRNDAGKDFAAVCDRIADQIGAAEVIVFEQSTHNPQLQEPDAFNALLRQTWTAIPPPS
jgi:pimeloyl-ACP methyl ester carboxylesterase